MPSGPTAADAVGVADGAVAGLFVVVLLLDSHPAKTPLNPTMQMATTSLGRTVTATASSSAPTAILSDRIAVRQSAQAALTYVSSR